MHHKNSKEAIGRMIRIGSLQLKKPGLNADCTGLVTIY